MDGKTVLAFLVEVAGGRRLLEALRERTADGETSVAIAAPQNQPAAGQIVDQDEIREAAQSRVEVTQAVLAEFGIDAVGVVMDPDPPLALDDAVRAFSPSEILISCLAGTRFGLLRRDLVEWARSRYEAPSSTSRSGSRTTPCAGTSPTRWWSRRRRSTAPTCSSG